MTMFGRTDIEILPSTARTQLVGATDLLIDTCRDVEVVFKQTTHAATPGLTLTLKDGDGATLLTSAAITRDSTVILRYGLDFANVANLSVCAIPPAVMTVEVAVGDTDSATYSIRRRTA